jgi:tRNA threonylcarbamoyladenosine biosynthesis protein TsaB
MAGSSLVLGLDTSGSKCGVAFWQDNSIVYQKTVAAPNLHSTLLAGFVRSGLNELNVPPEGLDLVCVTCGPGSFTGLRIGMAYAKGFCFALHKPLVAVSNFEVLADVAPAGMMPVYTLIDARRDSYYLGIFRKNRQVLDEYRVCASSALGEIITASSCVVWQEQDTGQRLILPFNLQALVQVLPAKITAAAVCTLGQRKYTAQGSADLEILEPLYIQSFAGAT